MINLCKNCPKRNTCTKLCPAAEAHANQDYVKQKELPIGIPIGMKEGDEDFWEVGYGQKKSREKLFQAVKLFQRAGFSTAEIVKRTDVPERTVTRWLKKSSSKNYISRPLSLQVGKCFLKD